MEEARLCRKVKTKQELQFYLDTGFRSIPWKRFEVGMHTVGCTLRGGNWTSLFLSGGEHGSLDGQLLFNLGAVLLR